VWGGFLISRLEIAYYATRCPLTAPTPVTACFLKLGFSYSLSSLTKRHPCTQFNIRYSSTCSLTSNDRGLWPPSAAPWIRQCYCPVLLFYYLASACLYMQSAILFLKIRPSVCPSVRHTRSGVAAKRLSTSSNSFHLLPGA